MAGDDVSRTNLSHLRNNAPAFLAGDRAAGMEHAAGGGFKGDGISPFSARGARARSTRGSGIGAASSSALV